jgi:hypothetical protein
MIPPRPPVHAANPPPLRFAAPMTPESRAWLDGLRAFAGAEAPPAPGDPAAAASHTAERGLLAAALVSWIDTSLAELLQERAAAGRDPEPAIVLTTTPAGFAAAADVLGRDDPLMRQWRERFACVSEKHYRLWCIRHPDVDYRLHVNHWNWIKTRVPQQRQPAFAAFPLEPDERYWLHRTGTAGAGRERRFCHLWKWNGRTASLLKPNIDESVTGL